MPQRKAVAYGVAMCLVELAPSVLVGPQFFVGFWGYLQPCRDVGNNNQLLEFYMKIVLEGRVSPCACSTLGLLVGLLLFESFFSVVDLCILMG